MDEDTRSLQALITGTVAGALVKAQGEFLDVDVEMKTDTEGNFTNEIVVTGRQSGVALMVSVEPLYDTLESVEEKVEAALDILESARRHFT